MADFAAGSGRRYRNSAVCPVPRTRRYSGLFVSASGHHRKPRCTDAVYTDKHAVFQPRRNPSDLPQVPRNGPSTHGSSTHGSSTQWGRALGELGITQILAHSPEAKGRVERANGTFQDRLVAELRLAGACTLAEANQVLTEFLPRFNHRFGVPAAQPESAYRQVDPELDPELDLGGVLCSCAEWPKTTRCNTTDGHYSSFPV